MKIVVLDDYADALHAVIDPAELRGHEVSAYRDAERDPDALVRRLVDADALILIQQRVPLGGAVLERLPRLRLIAQTGRNTAHLDLEACTRLGIAVSARGGVGSSAPTAELTWALILAALRDLPRQVTRLRDGQWLDSIGTTVKGKTLGVYAFGGIGSAVANVGAAFGMRVVCWGRDGSLARARTAGFSVAESRASFFQSADVLSLHLPLNAETRGIVTAADLAHMKSTALIVNTSRAGIIVRGALHDALVAGRPGSAAIDVFDEEPVLNASDPLLALPNVLATPHLGYSVREMYAEALGGAIEQIRAYSAGAPIDVVNPASLKSGRQLSRG
jgi:D-3-phosphoglycerate dehydrogenase